MKSIEVGLDYLDLEVKLDHNIARVDSPQSAADDPFILLSIPHANLQLADTPQSTTGDGFPASR
jgi:hypothetical protein